jgi:hypothetical protein
VEVRHRKKEEEETMDGVRDGRGRGKRAYQEVIKKMPGLG